MSTTTLSPSQRFWRLLKQDGADIRNIYIFAIFSGLLNLSLPLGIQATLTFLTAGELSTSWGMLVFFVVFGIALVGLLQVRQMGITEIIEQKIFTRAAFDFAYRLPRVRQSSIHGKYLPELVNRFFEIMTIQKGLSKILIDFSSSALQIIFGLLLLALYHPLFILFGITLIGIIYLIFRITGPAGLRTSLEESKYKFEVAHWLEEIGRTMTTFKLIGNSTLPVSKADKLVTGYLKARKKHFRILVWQFSGMIAFKVIVAAGLLILGSQLVIERQINLGQFIAAEIIILLVINSVEKLILSMSTIYDVLTALEKVGTVTDLPLEKEHGIAVQETNCDNGLDVDVKNLAFTFPDSKEPALHDLNFAIRSGQRALMAGPNGAGKTTLLKLMAGMYETFTGTIAYNGFPMGNLRIEALRAIIGDNFTDADVFKGSLLENIQAGRPEVTFELVKWAVKMTNLEEYISALPNGYDTQIDPEGKRLSSGIMRKIILARAVAEKPKLLLIEDTLLNLPVEERWTIYNRILDPQHGWSVVFVSNDLALAREVDKVIVINEGRVIEVNPYDQLKHKWIAFGTNN